MAMMVVMSSCTEDFLETVPTDAVSDQVALATPDGMLKVLNGLHRQMYGQSPLPGASWSRTGQSHFMPSLDAIGGNIIHSSPGNGWMRSDLQWNMHTNASSTTARNLWYQRYHFVASSNSIINAIVDNEIPLDGEVNNVMGQAYAYRAWAYLQLVSTYAKGYLIGSPSSDPGVPLLLDKGAPFESAPRSTVAEVYAQINSDIDNAIVHLADADAPKNKSHISLNAAYGIKARIALSQGQWDTAATAAAMARQGYPLLSEGEWLSGFNTYDLSEVIWGGRVIDSETNYYASFFYYISPTFNGSQNRSNPKIIAEDLYGMLPATDFRTKGWLPTAPNTNPAASNGQGGSSASDPNYDNDDDFWAAWSDVISTYGMTTRHNTHPYMTVKFLQKNPGTIDPDDVIYMRASEMYLIEAEAKAMSGDIAGAQAVLAAFGSSRDTAYDATVYTSTDALMDHIKMQRGVELWGEGFSYYDHIRWDMALDYSNTGASEVLYQDAYFQEKPSVNNAWIWKIPQVEIDTNPNLTEADQN